MSVLLLVTGPAGAGKTTTCEAFLKQASGTWAYVNQDTVRQFVKVGYASADGNESSWSDATKLQWETSIPVCCDIARRYLQHGINCLVDLSVSPEDFGQWEQYLDRLAYKFVVLLPPLEVDLQRNQDRAEPSRLTDEKIRESYDDVAAWKTAGIPVIDTSKSSIEQIVAELNRLAKTN